MAHAVEQVAVEIREISHVLLKDRCSIEFKYRYVKSDNEKPIYTASRCPFFTKGYGNW